MNVEWTQNAKRKLSRHSRQDLTPSEGCFSCLCDLPYRHHKYFIHTVKLTHLCKHVLSDTPNRITSGQSPIKRARGRVVGVKISVWVGRSQTILYLLAHLHHVAPRIEDAPRIEENWLFLNFLLSTGSLQARQFLWCGLCGLCWHNGLVQTKKQHQTTRLEWIDVVSACCLSIGFYRTGWMYGFLLFFQCLPRSLDSYESGSLSSLDSGCDVLV